MVEVAPGPDYRVSPAAAAAAATSGGATFFGFNAQQGWSPSVNVYETERAYIVCVDLAGIEKSKIDVELDGPLLRLRGHRAVPSEFDPECLGDGAGGAGASGDETHVRRCRIHVMEIDHGPFARSVELPSDADRGAITARYREGLLWIDVPKARR